MILFVFRLDWTQRIIFLLNRERYQFNTLTYTAAYSKQRHVILGLYQIYFFQSGRSRIWNDKSGQSWIFKLTVILLI